MFCTKCGAKNEDGAVFCMQCGNKLTAAEPEPEELVEEPEEEVVAPRRRESNTNRRGAYAKPKRSKAPLVIAIAVVAVVAVVGIIVAAVASKGGSGSTVSENVESSVSTETKKSAVETSEDEEPWVLTSSITYWTTKDSENFRTEWQKCRYYNSESQVVREDEYWSDTGLGANIYTTLYIRDYNEYGDQSVVHEIKITYDFTGDRISWASDDSDYTQYEFWSAKLNQSKYYEYTYDSNGKVRSEYSDGNLTEYTFDSNGNHMSTVYHSGTEDEYTTTYEYENGLLVRMYTEDGGRYADETVTTYTYDISGNLLTKHTETYDNDGTILLCQDYEYENGNAVTFISKADGYSYTETGWNAVYEYDADGNITKCSKTYWNDLAGEYGTGITEYEEDGHSYTQIWPDWSDWPNSGSIYWNKKTENYLPLSECLAQQGEIYADYKVTGSDSGIKLYRVPGDDCYIACYYDGAAIRSVFWVEDGLFYDISGILTGNEVKRETFIVHEELGFDGDDIVSRNQTTGEISARYEKSGN